MSSVAQMLRQAEALKASVSDSSKTISETWVMRQKLEDIYKKILLVDLEYALDKKVEQELWNHAFKNQITNLQTQAKDKQNVKRAEIQATLNLFLETASGFYLQFLQLICTTFKLDLPFRRKSAYFGILKERTQMKLKVTPPKKSSCLYVCQHCLVHLGDIARYRQQIDQAQTYYWHAAYLVPFNGQPYNQLAILEAAKGNKLSTVFYYVRSLAVKVPFPVAATNLEKLYAKLAKETPDFKGKLSASEMITGFLQFHALVHLCTDLEKAEDLSSKLAQGLPAHVTSQSFPWQVLVQIVAINIFALHHVQQATDGGDNSDVGTLTNGDCGDLSGDEERCFELVFSLTVSMLDILLQYTPKQEHKVRDYFTLPAIRLLLDWFRLNPVNFDRPVLKHSQLWGNLCKVLNSVQNQQSVDMENDISKYEDLPLPEDAELRCFQPIEKAQSGYSYSRVPADGIPSEVEVVLRCQRLLELGEWIIAEVPSIQLSMLGGKSGKPQFKSPTPPPQPLPGKVVVSMMTKPRSAPSINTASQKAQTSSVPTPSPEKRSNRQNVAIQAIIQKQAQDRNLKVKDDPASPKYLLGVPTSEPVFFKSGGTRQPGQPSPSPQGAAQTAPKPTGQPAGVLVLKSQEHLSQGTGKQQTKSSPSWQQQQQQQQQQQRAAAQWQQGKQSSAEKMNWSNTQVSPGQAQQQQKMSRGQGQVQLSPWAQQQQQQQAGSGVRPQLSPQTNQGQWQFPSQPNFGRGDYRSRSPTAPQPIRDNRPPHQDISNTPMQSPQGPPVFPQGQTRPPFPPGQTVPHGPVQNKEVPIGSPDQTFNKGMMYNKMPQGQLGPAGVGLQNDRFGVPGLSNMGSGDGGPLSFNPGQLPMFRHPPPARFPPPPNFMNPPPDLGSSQSTMQTGLNSPQITPPVTGPNPFSEHGLGNQTGFSHAPGTERQRMPGPPPSQNHQQPMPMHFQQGQFMNPFPAGFMGFSGLANNQLKSPLDGLFGKPRFPQDDIPPNMADIIGTLTKMAIQPPKENIPPQRGSMAFQGHAEGTPKPESFYTPQRSSSVPTVNIDLEPKVPEPLPTTTTPTQQQQQQQQQGTYSLFSGSPWLSSGDSKSLGSSPFSSQSGSMRNSPDPGSDTFSSDGKGLDMGLRYSGGGGPEEKKLTGSGVDQQQQQQQQQQQGGPFFQNNMQSLWSNQAQSPLERLLELQKQQRQTEPH